MNDPVVFVTTVQPVLVFWLAAITFFVALAVVAVFSAGRRWYELVALFLVAYLGLFSITTVLASWVTDIRFVDVEVISLRNS